MAITATTEWDVRTTGNDANGGGFDTASSGTDYSQQDTAQITYSDLVIGGTNTQLTSAASPFGATHVGNVVNVTGGTGFTVGRYQVLSVAGVVATMDRAVGTASSTAGAGKLGGGLLIPLTAMNAAADKNTVWIKSGTYTQAAPAFANNAAIVTWLNITGYGSAHNDMGTKPLLTTATNSVDLLRMSLGSSAVVDFTNLSLSNTAVTRGQGIQQYSGGGGMTLLINHCILDGFVNAVNGDNLGAHGFWIAVTIGDSEIKNSTSVALVLNTGRNVLLAANYIHNNSGDAIDNALVATLVGNIIANNSGYGFAPNQSGVYFLRNNTFASNTLSGVAFATTGSGQFVVQNNIFYGNGAYGITSSGIIGNSILNTNNAYGANTSGARNNFPVGTSDITLTANPFTNAAAGDYSLNSTAGGGAACKGVGDQWH